MAGRPSRPPCGTPEGFRWHRFLREDACDRCAAAQERHEGKLIAMRAGSGARAYQARLALARSLPKLPGLPDLPKPPMPPRRPSVPRIVDSKRPPVKYVRGGVVLRRDVYDVFLRAAMLASRGSAELAAAAAGEALELVGQNGTSSE